MKKLLITAFLVTVGLIQAEELKLSSYILNTTFSGDGRLKYIANDYEQGADSDYFTTRLRLNSKTKINDKLLVGSRILFQKEPIGDSTNATLTLPQLFLEYKTGNDVFRAGRLGSPIYTLSDNLIDTNIEGFTYAKKLPNTELKIGYLLKNATTSTKTSDEDSVIYTQAVQTIKLDKNSLLLEASIYSEDQGTATAHTSTTLGAADLNVVTAGFEYNQSVNSLIEAAQIRGQYIISDADNDNTGYSTKLTLGSKAIKNKDSWQAAFEYKKLEKDSYPYINADTLLDQAIVKVGLTTYVSPNSNLELAYEKHDYIKPIKITSGSTTKDAVDYQLLSATLNYTF